MKKVILTIILTSLFWWALFTYSAFKKSLQNSDTEFANIEQTIVEEVSITDQTEENSPLAKPAKPKTVTTKPTSPKQSEQHPLPLDCKEEIIGKWTPVEGAKNPLEFTKYGTVIQTVYSSIQSRSDYLIRGENIKIGYDDAFFKILKEDGHTYLEIYNSNDFSGRYHRKSQPKKINATIIDKSLYPTYIVGKWTPITGQKNPIEFTKFNTAIQTVYESIDSRNEYSLDTDKLSISYDKNARVVISEDANNYYLEIFNTTDFSGRYKKSK